MPTTVVRRLVLPLRHQRLRQDDAGRNDWERVAEARTIPVNRMALVLCDVWDRHWCRASETRLALLLGGMNQLTGVLRDAGVLIVHAPSETMAFYAGAPARERVLAAPRVDPPLLLPHPAPPLPVQASEEDCCDTPPDAFDTLHRPWTRQHPAIEIDQDRDAISDDGLELYSLYRQRCITTVLIMGVHANMCILNRTFAIKSMVRSGIEMILVRDLTDAMYNPAMPPYVSHDEGTNLIVEYIEKFWCPTTTNAQVIQAAAES